jgi:hypothetical protein
LPFSSTSSFLSFCPLLSFFLHVLSLTDSIHLYLM